MSSERPFAGFLDSPDVYERAAGFWAGVLESPEWQVGWLTTTYGDGTPMQDGNPIVSAINEKMRRAVRVIQQDDDPPELSGWISRIESAHGTVEELVIDLVATVDTIGRARACLSLWMRGASKEASLKCLR